jgi:hypothetical protein
MQLLIDAQVKMFYGVLRSVNIDHHLLIVRILDSKVVPNGV